MTPNIDVVIKSQTERGERKRLKDLLASKGLQ